MGNRLTTGWQNRIMVGCGALLMKQAGDEPLRGHGRTDGQPIGIITEADIAHAVADGKDGTVSDLGLMTLARP